MRRVFKFLILISFILVTSMACSSKQTSEPKRYQATFLELFDTVTTIVGYANSQEEFQELADDFKSQLEEYHQLFDIYNDYDGINNLKTINDHAGKDAVQVDERLIELLLFCREMYEHTDGKVNAAMGSVLSLWHDARTVAMEDATKATLPSMEALEEASKHTDFSEIIIDTQENTVQIPDPQMRLDVGAIAKGYAAQQVCKQMPKGLLVSIGGNVKATGSKPIDGSAWTVGIQDPDGANNEYIYRVSIEDLSVVSSGDYQRYFTVDGIRYHHIIDPQTLYPATSFRAITILCEDSGVADGLSTALFLMNQEDGEKLLEKYDAQALWIDANGNTTYSEGFSDYLKK